MARPEGQPQPPGIWERLSSFGKAKKRHEDWGDFYRQSMRTAADRRERDERVAAWGPIENSLGIIQRLTLPVPFFPPNLNFAVLQRSQSGDPSYRFWDLLEVPPQGNDQLLVLMPNPLSPTGEFDPQTRDKLHLVSRNQHLVIGTGMDRWWPYYYRASANVLPIDDYDTWRQKEVVWTRTGATRKSFPQESAMVTELLLFTIDHLTNIKANDNQIVLLQSLKPEADYYLLQQEPSTPRRSPFEFTSQEFLGWLAREDAGNISNLETVLERFAQEKGFSMGIVAVGSMIDPTRRWSSVSTGDIDLLFYLATGKDNSYNPDELASFLGENLGWGSRYSIERTVGDYPTDHPPYFRLQPPVGKRIEIHPEWQTWETPQNIGDLISIIRGADRFQMRNPYFAVLIEP